MTHTKVTALDALLHARIAVALCSLAPSILPPATEVRDHLAELLRAQFDADRLARLETLTPADSGLLSHFMDEVIAAYIRGYRLGYLDGCGGLLAERARA